MKLLKECKTSLIISAVILTIPIFHILECLKNSLIVSEFLIVASVGVFTFTFLFSLIRKIPYSARIGIVSVITVFAFLFLGYLRLIGGTVGFRVYSGETVGQRYDSNYNENYLFDCGNYEDVTQYVYKTETIFESSGYTYIFKYSDVEFEKAKSRIDDTVKFYEESLQEGDPVPEFTVDGFDFRLMVTEDDYYPKWMKFLGINNDTKEIAFVDFEMPDLDCVTDFGWLLNDEAGWYYISEKRAD